MIASEEETCTLGLARPQHSSRRSTCSSAKLMEISLRTRNILITGSQGFVGRHLVSRLSHDGYGMRLAQRTLDSSNPSSIYVGEINAKTDWRRALEGCDTVIHLAGQASAGTAGLCENVNNLGTFSLVRQSADSEIKTFIFVSSVMAVVDNHSLVPLSDETASSATSDYGTSKLRAERHVEEFGRSHGVGIVLRPPAIYGPGAKGNWRVLHQLARSALPLPFASISNKRTFISVDNFVDAVASVINAAAPAVSGTHVVSDADAISLPDIIRLLREGMRLPPRLFAVPQSLLKLPFVLTGRSTEMTSLFGDLVVDCSGFRQRYGWSPPKDVAQAIIEYGRSPRVR